MVEEKQQRWMYYGGEKEKEKEREREKERDRLKLPNNTDGDCTGIRPARDWLPLGCRQNPIPVIFRLHTHSASSSSHIFTFNPNRDARKDKITKLQTKRWIVCLYGNPCLYPQ